MTDRAGASGQHTHPQAARGLGGSNWGDSLAGLRINGATHSEIGMSHEETELEERSGRWWIEVEKG